MRIKCLCLVFVMLLCCVGVQAAGETFTDMDIDYNRANCTIDISGTAAFSENISDPVRLMLLTSAEAFEELKSGDKTFAEVGIYADETMLTADKTFTFEQFKVNENLSAGDYYLRIVTDGEVYTDTIAIASVEEAKQTVNHVATADEVAENIKKYNDVYELDLEGLYKAIGAEGQAYVHGKLSQKSFADLQAFQDEFYIHSALYKIYLGPWGTNDTVIEANKDLLGLDMSDFNALSSYNKDKVYKALTGTLYNDAEAFEEAFDDAVDAAADSGGSGSGSGSGSGRPTGSVVYMPENVAPEETKVFTDLEDYAWAEPSVMKLYDAGVVSGRDVNQFVPAGYVTRAEAAKMLVLAFDILNSDVCSFTDVTAGSWMYPYMAAAEKANVILGYPDGSVGVNERITREDFAVMVYRIKNTVTLGSSAFSDDAAIADYAKEAVYALKEAGIINGVGDNMFLPKNHVTRAEAAKIVAAMME